ncbi:MAG: carboxylating nicotinate-nucleotide diphosphorylase [Verrucomicrobia bacterium]|nr:carboxylating nicotinate-nucleotide diphosphorylase [Verrucomicrobiota bacterium]MDA1086246.1 carboxylating nicotinate-nucleotide diphosphorylase [Verrucomicrobiota bacterium]
MELTITSQIHALIDLALREDIGSGDATSESLIDEAATCSAEIISRGAYVVAGIPVAAAVFARHDARVVFEACCKDGDAVASGDTVARLQGPARSVLTAERTALNFLQRLSGVATLTRAYVLRAAGRIEIRDTRKTTPGMRDLEKHAVRSGGGQNHRMRLDDMALIKDNHRMLWRRDVSSDVGRAVSAVRDKHPGVPIEIEVECVAELKSALEQGPDWILLDNMKPDTIRTCVAICAGRSKIEASGGITLDNIELMAETGIDAVAIGALTHSAPASDFSLEFVGPGSP